MPTIGVVNFFQGHEFDSERPRDHGDISSDGFRDDVREGDIRRGEPQGQRGVGRGDSHVDPRRNGPRNDKDLKPRIDGPRGDEGRPKPHPTTVVRQPKTPFVYNVM